MKSIGQLIRERRTEMNLTKEQLAKMVGIAKSTLDGYETNGAFYMSERLADALRSKLKMKLPQTQIEARNEEARKENARYRQKALARKEGKSLVTTVKIEPFKLKPTTNLTSSPKAPISLVSRAEKKKQVFELLEDLLTA